MRQGLASRVITLGLARLRAHFQKYGLAYAHPWVYNRSMNSNDYVVMVGHTMRAQPTWRFGQACFNVLFQYRPERAESIRGTSLDPFYRESDDKPFWDSFYAWLATWMID